MPFYLTLDFELVSYSIFLTRTRTANLFLPLRTSRSFFPSAVLHIGRISTSSAMSSGDPIAAMYFAGPTCCLAAPCGRLLVDLHQLPRYGSPLRRRMRERLYERGHRLLLAPLDACGVGPGLGNKGRLAVLTETGSCTPTSYPSST